MHSMLSAARESLTPFTPSRISDLVEAYQNAFDGVPVSTLAQLEAGYRLRYQVFCIENKIFDPAKNPGGLECDAYDEHSVHAVLLHRTTQTIVGTVRLVLPKPGARQGSLLFHQLCRHPRLKYPNFLPLKRLERSAGSPSQRRSAPLVSKQAPGSPNSEIFAAIISWSRK